MTETSCPRCGAVTPCEHAERQLVYEVPDALKTPAKPMRKAVRTRPTPASPEPTRKPKRD